VGTTFEIYLPRAEDTREDTREGARGDAKAPAPVAGRPGDPTSAPRGAETILLVEDEAGIREVAFDFLQARGYKVLTAVDGNEALRIAEGHEDLIHILVTDMAMPNVGGKELALRLRQVRPQIKVLFMSGYPTHPASVSEDVPGQTTVLQKPFLLDTLAQKVRTLLDQE
jgi:DNA-binding NtrC family response regulator